MSFNGLVAQITEKSNRISGIASTITAVSNLIRAGATTEDGATRSPTTDSTATERSTPGPMKNETVAPGQLIPGITPPPWPNELEPFASYNNIITLSILTQEEINDPIGTFRVTAPSINILRSGGGVNKPQTAVEQFYNLNTEFFIDNLEMNNIITAKTSTGNTNVTNLTFEVQEPYSMGLFIETLRVAALKAGWESHIEAPYLLTLEFPGWDENNNSGVASYSTRMIPIKIIDIQFEVSASGSNYSVEAIAWNEQCLADNTQRAVTDIEIKGRTVSEILQSGLESLATVLNNRELTKEETGQTKFADQYVFMFPKPGELGKTPTAVKDDEGDSATIVEEPAGVQDTQVLYQSIQGSSAELTNIDVFEAYKTAQLGKVQGRSKLGEAIRGFAETEENINTIGKKEIIEDWITQGAHPFGKEGFAYDQEKDIYVRGNTELQLSDDVRTFKFKMGTKVQDIIEEIILASSYAKEIDEKIKNPPADGKIKWFKIETQCFILQNNEALRLTGRYPRIFVYRVIEFQTHVNIFKSPTSATHGIPQLKSECAKQYQYIYTGKNVDILDFEIRYNHAYNTPILADKGQSTQRVDAAGAVIQTQDGKATTANDAGGSGQPAEGAVRNEDITSTGTGDRGGSSYESPETSVARMFNHTLLKSAVGLINIDLTVKGDPFYISDSGLGNYNAGDTSYTNINSDGAMNYQNGEVHINVIFRTPIDYNTQTGTMYFPENTKIVNAFSGIFRVNEVKNTISSNQFKQTLVLNRVMGQEETDPASLFADGTGANSILNLVPGGIFDADRNVITTSLAALEEALTGLNGSSLTQLQAASTSQVRQLIGGLTQLTAGINQLATGIAVPLDPTQTLQGFANQSIAQAETAASTALRNIGSIG